MVWQMKFAFNYTSVLNKHSICKRISYFKLVIACHFLMRFVSGFVIFQNESVAQYLFDV